MKKVRVEDAVGLTLCHDITAMRDGFKGPAFSRGHIIQEEDIPELLDIGKKTVFIWEENVGEIHEEDAALRMAAMTPVEGAHFTKPSEGKVNLIADVSGMFRVDRELLKEVNSIGDLTICTLPDHYPVTPGTKLASMRIIPLVTEERQIARAEALCLGRKLYDLRPYESKKVGIVITGSEVYTGRIKDKFEGVLRAKMVQFPSEIIGVTFCDDDLDMITDAAKAHIENGADLLFMTGGMSVDPDDLTPSAIKRLGAEIISYGVPAQPGNMTLIAYLSNVTIMGVPGASISRPTTVFDALMPQIFAGDRITKEDLINLGDGGACLQCSVCHFPNCMFGKY